MLEGGIMDQPVRNRSRHWPVGIAVLAIALLTSACWRAAPIDGPGAAPGIGTTADPVPNDKAATSVQVLSFANLPVVLASDSATHAVRIGAFGGDSLWRWFLVDGPGSTGTGATTDSVGGGASILQSGTDGSGFPIVEAFYFDSTTNSLRHATFAGGTPAITRETVDGSGSTAPGHVADTVGQFANPSFVTGGNLHVLYAAVHRTNPGATVRLRHAVHTGQGWIFQDVDGPGGVASGATADDVGQNASVAFAGDFEHAFYFDATTFRLRHAKFDGSTWTAEDLDGPGVPGGAGRTSDHVGGGSTAAVATSDGHLHVFYVDNTASRLRHGEFDGTSWTFTNLDGPGIGGGSGRSPDLMGGSVSVAQNAPAPFIDVVYTNLSTLSLRHAQWNGSMWRFETIDGAGNFTVGGTTDQVGFPTITGAVTQQMNAAVYGGASSSILHVFTGDKTTGALREECTLGVGILAPANCAN